MKRKKIFICSRCKCRLRERKVHRDADGKIFCLSCFKKNMENVILPKNIRIFHTPSKAERENRKKVAKRLGIGYQRI